MKAFYLLCAIAGAVIPYSQFVPWVAEHGLDVKLLALELFSTRIGAVGVSCGLPLFLLMREQQLSLQTSEAK